MSQTLVRLTRELAVSGDPIQRAEIQARIACDLARLGRFDEARKCIDELRVVFADGHSGRASVWIMLAEGLVHHYSQLSPLALDRITRVQVLGIAMKYAEITALASAWKAHIEFEFSKFEAMIESLKIALASVTDSDNDAQTRLSMVLSNSFMLCGDRERAKFWFVRGRKHAVANGDQASIEAMLYNRAAFSLAHLRVERCCSGSVEGDLRTVRSEIESAKNLQALTQIAAMTNHIHLWSARLCILEKKYSAAIEGLNSVRFLAPFSDRNFSQAAIDIEICYCLSRLGDADGAYLIFQKVDFHCFANLDIDERLLLAWIRWQLALTDSRFGDPALAMAQMQELKNEYLSSRVLLTERLQSLGLDA